MFKLSFNTYTAEDDYWRSSLRVQFDSPMKFLCAGDQVCLNDQYSIGNLCINHSVDSQAIKRVGNDLADWLKIELEMLNAYCPTMLTAVHAEKYYCVSEVKRGELRVSAISTAGIKSNAVNVYHDRKREEEQASIGTVNIILCTNINLTEAAMAQALGIVYESKASLFYDNNWQSTYSDNIATGTGTDSVIIASSVNAVSDQINYSGSHSILAGMISEVVRESIQCSVNKVRAGS